jgi:hypothetical protein
MQKIKDLIDQVRTAMPFLITLTTKDRMDKYKMRGVSPCTLTFPSEADPFLTPPLYSCTAS